jgi:hypothetical protein
MGFARLFEETAALPMSRATRLPTLQGDTIMANQVKEKVADVGHAVADTAKTVGHKIAAGAEKAVNFVKDKTGLGEHCGAATTGASGIKEHMDVIASCGTKVGVVDHVEGAAIKLTKKNSRDSQHHFIPTAWVARVDSHVHLTKNSKETELHWKSDAASCGCGG